MDFDLLVKRKEVLELELLESERRIKGLTNKQTRKHFEVLENRQYQPRALKELFGV